MSRPFLISQFVFAVILCLLVAFTIAGCRQEVQAPQGPTVGESTAKSWISFISEAMGRCEANCCVDYQALKEHEGEYFGVTVVGYRDSEYILDLFRYDSEEDKWVESPRTDPQDGYPAVDVHATSEQWNVPEATIREWINRAENTVQKKYASQ